MKNLKKLGFVSFVTLALTACSGPASAAISFSHTDFVPGVKPTEYTPYEDDDLYDAFLGEYRTLLEDAHAEKDDDVRYAKYAAAEAALLDSGLIAINATQGGNYAISRVAYRTAPQVFWGNDADRYESLVVTKPNATGNNFITSGDRADLKAAWDNAKAGKGSYDPKAILTGKGYEISDTYSDTYSEDPATLDALATYHQNDTEIIMQGLEGLYKYDNLGNRNPAMAVGEPTISSDGLTYTFKIRNDAYWYTADGRQYAKVTADDFVAGFEHMLDAQAGLEYLADGIVGATDYYSDSGTPEDFARSVGYKAIDDNTLEIKLVEAESFFLTRLEYSCFMPMNRQFFLDKGGVFGVDAFATRKTEDAYVYGNTADISSILYNSAYILKQLTSQSVMTAELNTNYYNASKVSIKNIRWVYDDGTNPIARYNAAVNGDYVGSGLGEASGVLALAKTDGNFDKYQFVTDTNATTYFGGFNVNRITFEHGTVVSPKTTQEKIDYRYAIQFADFRRALQHAWDRVTFNAASVGEACASYSLRNTYTPPEFVSLSKDVKINDKLFPQGTTYGEMVQYFLKEFFGRDINTADGQDGWYNPTLAQSYLAKAKEQMGDSWAKVKIDLLAYSGSPTNVAQAQLYKNSIETVLGSDNVEVNITYAANTRDYYYSAYYASSGALCCEDLYYGSGWGPDFGDPRTYLDTMQDNVTGSMTKLIGLY